MNTIVDISIDRTNDNKQFDIKGKNWFIAIRFSNKKRLGFELKPEMVLSEIVFELVKFTNLLILQLSENQEK
jgi:hypothetical protein